jgi:hypothetical protein
MSKQSEKEELIKAVTETQASAGVLPSADLADKFLTPILEEQERKRNEKQVKHTFDTKSEDESFDDDVCEGDWQKTKTPYDVAEVDFATGEAFDSEGNKLVFQRTAADRVRDRTHFLMKLPKYKERLDQVFLSKYIEPKKKNQLIRGIIEDSIREFGDLK